MWYWAELVRLTRAMRHLYNVRSNVLPRLDHVRAQLETCGRLAESYEIQNIMMYLTRLNKDTVTEVQNQYHMIAQAYGVTAPRTTPLLATNGDIQSS